MNISHDELQTLFDSLLSENIKLSISSFVGELEVSDNQDKYSQLWIADQLLGGVGGYCMPANPVKNPFPGGEQRELYRPLQYARSDMELCDIRLHARYVVSMCGMHLESVCRMFLKRNKHFGTLRFGNTTLGKAVQQIEGMKIIEPNIIENLFLFVKVYNRSKHEINQDDSKDRLFNASDACVSYFSARILGLNILRYMGVSESFEQYEVNK